MTTRLAALVLFTGSVTLVSAGHAQDKKAGPAVPIPPAEWRHAVVPVAGDAAALAELLGEHVPAETRVSAAPAGDAVLVSGPAADDVAKLVRQLGRPAGTVAVEVVFADVTFKKGDAADLSVPDVLGKLDDLARAGQAVDLRRVKLTALEGRPVSAQTGASKPVTTADAVGGRAGVVPRTVSYRDSGTTVKLTARSAAGAVTVDLSAESSGVRPADAEGEAAAGAPAFETVKVSTRVSVPDGKPVVVHETRRDGPAGRSASLIVVTARVVR